MSKYIYIFIIFIVLFSNLFSQEKYKRESRYGFDVNKRPAIYYDIFTSYKSMPEVGLFLVLNIQYDVLQFTQKDGGFESAFEIGLNIREKDGNTAQFAGYWQENIRVEEFDKTNAKNLYARCFKKFVTSIDTGLYEIYLEIRDTKSDAIYFNKRDIRFEYFGDDIIKTSQIAFLSDKDSIPDKINITGFDKVVEFNQPHIFYFELYDESLDSVNIQSRLIKTDDEEVVYQNRYMKVKEMKNFYFSEKLNRSYFEENSYKIIYTLKFNGKEKSIERLFDVVWFEKPVYMYKYDLAIRPMQYIMDSTEIHETDDLNSSELEKWYNQFWKEKDPTETTPFNEVQYEFYQRVDLANKKFSTRYNEGWETDFGKYLILYGEPDKTERTLHTDNKTATVIWIYNNLDKKIIFSGNTSNNLFKMINIEKTED